MSIILTDMTEEIRNAVRARLAERRVTQKQMAEDLDVSHQYVSSVLTGKAGELPKTWARILDYVGLRLVAVPQNVDVVLVPQGARVEVKGGEGEHG